VAHLVTALSALAWHGRDRYASGIEVPASSRQARIRPWHWPVLLQRRCTNSMRTWLLSAASLVVVVRLAERPRLPHDISRVDTAGSRNSVVEKMGVAERNLKRLERHFAFSALPLRRRPPAHAHGRWGTPLTWRRKLQCAARKLSHDEDEAFVALPRRAHARSMQTCVVRASSAQTQNVPLIYTVFTSVHHYALRRWVGYRRIF
jgi:hypothetical protein